MTHHLLTALQRSVLGKRNGAKRRNNRQAGRQRTLAMESLESRQLLAVVPLQNLSVKENTGEKPQSKIWEYAGQWWTVMPNSSGTSIFRLDGTSWTATTRITTKTDIHADVKPVGDLAHVLLFDGNTSQLATLQYDATDNRFEPWLVQPQVVSIPLGSSVETATIEVDTTGRMWVAYDTSSNVEVRYSDGDYTTWSAPINIASGISSDDISVITKLPNGSVGVMWSNQKTSRFGFRTHLDTAAANAWSAMEIPASQTARSGMADDHLNTAVASDGTLYAAVKTSFGSGTLIGLVVRRPNGVWDSQIYQVDTKGTRPIVVLNEEAGRLMVAYTTSESGGDIVYRESPLGVINLAPKKVLIPKTVNNVTSTRQNFTDKVVFLAAGGSNAKGAIFSFDTITVNQPPQVSAGPDRSIAYDGTASLDGSASDDNLPAPPSLTALWSKFSGPGNVVFGNSALVDTTATFTASGTYVLRLTASDGQRSSFDEMTVTVDEPSNPGSQDPPQPGGGGEDPVQIAFQDGLFPSITYAGTRDTKIASRSASTNYGTAQTIDVDGSPDVADLFKWDISAIPTGSIIVSAAIELNVTDSTSGSYEVYALQRAWDELSATWQRYATGLNWSTAGALGSGDHGTQVLGQFGATNNGIYRINLNDAGVAAVQAWVNDPNMNYGIIIQDYSISSGADISTRETSNASLRPKLIINYESPPAMSLTSLASPNLPPIVDVGPSRTVQRGQPLQLNAVVGDDGKPDGLLLSLLWSKVSGPGTDTVTFDNPASASAVAQFAEAGDYVLRLTVSDGELNAFDELNVTVI